MPRAITGAWMTGPALDIDAMLRTPDGRPRCAIVTTAHLSDQERIGGPDDIIAQADRAAPVDGWYPTSRWSAGEIVRDDYLIPVPEGRDARLISVGLYTTDGAGGFQNLGAVDIPLPS